MRRESMVWDEDFVVETFGHIKKMRIKYDFLLNVSVIEGNSKTEFCYKKNSKDFIEVDYEEYQRLKKNSPCVTYEYKRLTDKKYDYYLEVFIRSGSRREGVRYRVQVVDDIPKIIEGSGNIILKTK